MIMIINIIICVLCVTAGYILGLIFLSRDNTCGELVVDTSNEATDKWLIKLNEPTSKTAGRGYVVLKVVHRELVEEDGWPNER